MNENNNLSAIEKARQLTQPFQDNRLENYRQNIRNISTLEDEAKIQKFIDEIDKLISSLSAHSSTLVGSADKLAPKIENINSALDVQLGELKKGSNDWKKSSDAINKIIKTILDNEKIYSKQARKDFEQILSSNQDLVDIAARAASDAKKKSATAMQELSSTFRELSEETKKLGIYAGVQKMVLGGQNLSSLRDMQHGVKVNLGIDTNAFMSLQGSLVDTNKALAGDMTVSFKDTISYLSSIKEYSFKSYDQASAMYKQVMLGTKYLGLTNQNIASLVSATNAIADQTFMDRQLAMLSALSSDSSVSENVTALSDFIANNATAVAGRYSNYQSILQSATGINSVAQALFGSDSQLITNLMAEIMGKSDFSQLSSNTQMLLSYTGQASNVWSQMASGNLNMANIISGVLNGSGNLNQYQRTTLENLGLGDWVTMSGDYTRNQDEYNNLLRKQTELLAGIDLSTEEGRALAEKNLAQQNEDATFFEKFETKVFNALGIQNQNWTAVLGLLQVLQVGVNAIAGINWLATYSKLNQILFAVSSGKLGSESGLFKGLSSGGSGILSTLGGALGKGGLYAGGASTAIAATAAIGGALLGGSMMYSDYKQNGVKGALLGNADFDKKSGWDNAKDVLSNTSKYAAIGAAIGTVIPGVGTLLGAGVGALAGAISGLAGGLVGNTEAVKDNTKVLNESNDSIVTNSYIGYKYNSLLKGNNTGNVTYGVSNGLPSTGGVGSAASYPWRISSGFGSRVLPNGDSTFHSAYDFGIAEGTPIGAPKAGTVTSIQIDPRNTYPNGSKEAGSGIYIRGTDGVLYQFWHLSKVGVKEGQTVTAGQTIGLSGNTGYSNGAHLHFGTKVGTQWVDPAPYITPYLFQADGKFYDASSSTLDATSSSSSPAISASTAYLSKEQLFTGAKAGGPKSSSPTSGLGNLAKSEDIDRLIKVISELNAEQTDQRQMLQALAGKNTFVYTM